MTLNVCWPHLHPPPQSLALLLSAYYSWSLSPPSARRPCPRLPLPYAGPSCSSKLFLSHCSAHEGYTRRGSFLFPAQSGSKLAEMDHLKPEVLPARHCSPSLGMRALEAGIMRFSVPPSIR